LENCAGGVHDQLWQKNLWKETEENFMWSLSVAISLRSHPERSRFSGEAKDSPCQDYQI